jgi:aminopeptidase C
MPSVSALTALTATASAVSYAHIASFQESFRTNPAYRLAQNAVTQTSVEDIALNRDIVTSIDHSFSTTLDDWSVTHQKRSGRCWMFAGLNLFRPGAMARMHLKNFEFSMNDSWFDEYLFEIAAHQSYLPASLHAALEEEPLVLPAWDIMGSLAGASSPYP